MEVLPVRRLFGLAGLVGGGLSATLAALLFLGPMLGFYGWSNVGLGPRSDGAIVLPAAEVRTAQVSRATGGLSLTPLGALASVAVGATTVLTQQQPTFGGPTGSGNAPSQAGNLVLGPATVLTPTGTVAPPGPTTPAQPTTPAASQPTVPSTPAAPTQTQTPAATVAEPVTQQSVAATQTATATATKTPTSSSVTASSVTKDQGNNQSSDQSSKRADRQARGAERDARKSERDGERATRQAERQSRHGSNERVAPTPVEQTQGDGAAQSDPAQAAVDGSGDRGRGGDHGNDQGHGSGHDRGDGGNDGGHDGGNDGGHGGGHDGGKSGD